MPKTSGINIGRLLVEALLIVIGLLFLVPFYFLLVNSVKTFGEILSNSAALPSSLHFSNYAEAWESINFPSAFGNSLLVTIVSNALLLLIS